MAIADSSLTLKMYTACSIMDDAWRHESVSEKQYEAKHFYLFSEKFIICLIYLLEESIQFSSTIFNSVMIIERVYLLYKPVYLLPCVEDLMEEMSYVHMLKYPSIVCILEIC
jgi:hypothetical protein